MNSMNSMNPTNPTNPTNPMDKYQSYQAQTRGPIGPKGSTGPTPDGWGKEQRERDIQTLFLTFTATRQLENDSGIENYVKAEFSKDLAQEIFKRELFVMEKEKTHVGTNYKVAISIAPEFYSKYTGQRDIFRYQGLPFEASEIEKAIMNTYPERFL